MLLVFWESLSEADSTVTACFPGKGRTRGSNCVVDGGWPRIQHHRLATSESFAVLPHGLGRGIEYLTMSREVVRPLQSSHPSSPNLNADFLRSLLIEFLSPFPTVSQRL